MKTIFYIFLIIIFSICLIYFSGDLNNSQVLAASGSSTSDLQLMARAINRRSKRRKLRRAGCSWCSYNEQGKT